MDEYWVPEHVKDYLRGLGFVLPLDDMEPWIRSWDDWMGGRGDFYDYRDKDGLGRVYEVHRRSIHPAMRVCKEWGSLLLNEDIKVVCEDQEATDWIGEFFSSTNSMAQAQATVVRTFGLGTGAWALWVDLDRKKVRIRHYDARMVIPLTWDEDGVTERAFVTRAFYRGKAVDQLQMHLRSGVGFFSDLSPSSPSTPSHEISNGLLTMNDEETYKIVTVCFDHEGNELAPVGVAPAYDTGCAFPTFGIVKPAVTNTRVDMSPYGQSVFADAVDAVQAVNLTFDALINAVDVSKMRVFLSDVLFDREKSGDKAISIPFGKQDCTVFRKVMSTEDTIQEFAPALRTSSQSEAFRIALQMLGDLTGFGIGYFDFDESHGYVRTATEVSSDNSALMRNIRRHENALQGPIVDIARAAMCVSRGFCESIPNEGVMSVMYDDSIIQDVAAEKAQDMAEVGVTMNAWEYRAKWYGEDEKTARSRAREIGKADSGA
jgi:A118 family predicted phage portal protein